MWSEKRGVFDVARRGEDPRCARIANLEAQQDRIVRLERLLGQ